MSPDAYSPGDPDPQPAQPRRVWPWVLGGVLALVFLLFVGLVASVIWIGGDLFLTQAETAIREDPQVRAHLGTLNKVELDFLATGSAPGVEEFAFRVEGTLGSGLLVGEFITTDAEHEELRSGELRLDDGRRIAIGTRVQRKDLQPINP